MVDGLDGDWGTGQVAGLFGQKSGGMSDSDDW